MPRNRATKGDREDLLRGARQGGGTALGHLLEAYRDDLTLALRARIGRRLQSKVDPSDLVQEIFLKAHRDFGRFRGGTEEEFAGWLRQVAATCLATLVRRYYGTRRRDVRLECELADDLDRSSGVLERSLVDRSTSPSDQAARRERAALLADALSRLPDDYRDVILLRHTEGLSFPEVARRLDRSLDSVKKLWMRALDRMRHNVLSDL